MAPLEDEAETGEVNIEEEEEAAPLKHAPDPAQPSEEEVENHRVTHYPFRTWCKLCIMGRGTGSPHRSSTGSSIPRIGMDYFFITEGGMQRRSDLDYKIDAEGDEKLNKDRDDGKIVKCLIVRCMETKIVFAHVVPQKGDDEEHYCANLVAADRGWLGHAKLILKADNERAVAALKRRVAKILKDRAQEEQTATENVQQEQPAAYDSQSNGGVEVGVRLVRGMFRTLKLCLEARLGKYVPTCHPVVAWLLEHACTVLNAKSRGPDGLTPWERVKGRAFNQRLLAFGECILHKLPTKGPRSQPDGNMGTKWDDGVFLGFNRSANTYIVATTEGIVNVRSIYRRPQANRWDFSKLAAISSTPWSLREKQQVRVQFAEGERDPEAARRIAKAPRAFKITFRDLMDYGFTEGCVQCEYTERHGKSKGGLAHSAACRQRIVEAAMETPAGRARLAAYEERVDQALADRRDGAPGDDHVPPAGGESDERRDARDPEAPPT